MGSSGNAEYVGNTVTSCIQYKPTCIKHLAFFFWPLVFLMFSARQRDLPILLEDHHLHLPSIQLLHQSKTTTLTLGRLMLGGYGVNKDPYCHKVEKVIFKNKCEPYKEKTCWTQNEEICSPVRYKNCTGVIETNIERVCFNVNELVCNLVEAVHYETLEETYQVQRCFTGKDRV